ncbi:mediator of RNA polymerase II transcription subunit 15 [Drosophila gunungcola]|uniref:mediator of RNA polymerase II transcription subunit 15 n=1 Tax=Drosophila gunungcola TaxID=103775 RepID=UPI0022E3DFC5|nr:mediator of RNA polymerase II transcription subunit 15 [Drosophila gunungcola]
MDPKRGNASGARQGGGGGYHASKTSVASRHGGGGGGVAVGHKQPSQVSLTPSQARNPENPRKSPLDALSRSGIVRNQNPFQRRSGLQDVDDAFLASNAFARPLRVRHSGLDKENMAQAAAGGASAGQPGLAAGAPIINQQQYQQMPPPDAGQQQQMPSPGAVPSQQYMQPAAGQPTRLEPAPSGRAHVHQQQMQQQMQQQQQMPQQGGYDQQQQQQVAQPDAQMQNKYATQQQHQLQPQHQMPQHGYPTQPPATGAPHAAPPAAGGVAATPGGAAGGNVPRENGGGAAPPDAEMCTTCPNCQTTIYLVRTAELGHGDAGMPVQ